MRRTSQEQRVRNVRSAWLTFLLCLAGFAWLCSFVPPWDQSLPPNPGHIRTPVDVLFVLIGFFELAIMAVCLWWILPSAYDALWLDLAQFMPRKLKQRWYDFDALGTLGEKPAREDWLDISEPMKTALLDLTMGSGKKEKPWPEALPPLTPAALAQRLQKQVDQTLAQVVDMMNQSPKGEIAPELQPRFKQLFKDLEHDIVELGRQLRIQAAYEQLPPPQGHWAERYRQMKKDTALRTASSSPLPGAGGE